MSTHKLNPRFAPDWLAIVQKNVGSLDYGSVEIVIHDSRIVQIETTERLRLASPARADLSHPLLTTSS